MTAPIKLTTAQAMRVLGVSDMTLWLWRKGTPTKTPLPFHDDNEGGGRPMIHYRASEITAWAKKNGVELAETVESVLKSPTATLRKSGPKSNGVKKAEKPAEKPAKVAKKGVAVVAPPKVVKKAAKEVAHRAMAAAEQTVARTIEKEMSRRSFMATGGSKQRSSREGRPS